MPGAAARSAGFGRKSRAKFQSHTDTAMLQHRETALGCAEYAVLEPSEYPVGFSVEGTGLCFCHFKSPISEGNQARSWEVGVDFGTSNTCIAFKEKDGNDPAAPLGSSGSDSHSHAVSEVSVDFKPPETSNRERVTELAAATLDFFPPGSNPGDAFISREE